MKKSKVNVLLDNFLYIFCIYKDVITMTYLDKPRKLRPAISSDVNTKKHIVDSLAIVKSSFDIAKETNYPASTIRSFHRKNKELIQAREKEIEAILPDIITDLQFRTKTSVELSMHKYRPDIFPNDTGYTDTQDIIQFQNNLSKPHQKILGKMMRKRHNHKCMLWTHKVTYIEARE